MRRIKQAMEYRNAESDEAVRGMEQKADEHARAVVALGPPGAGKTYVMDYLIRQAQSHGARVMACMPTGQLASEVRSRHPDVEVDTCHGGLLLFKPLREVMPLMLQYDVVIIDEISQLNSGHFDHIIQLWEAAGKIPFLMFLGDFWQLPAILADGTEPVYESRYFRSSFMKKVEF